VCFITKISILLHDLKNNQTVLPLLIVLGNPYLYQIMYIPGVMKSLLFLLSFFYTTTLFAQEKDSLKTDSALVLRHIRLTNDDPVYNKKYPGYIPAIEVFSLNGLSMVVNRYVSKQSWAYVGFNSWSYNIRTGWEWDIDEFSANFFTHPYGGTVHFNFARSNGYSYWESLPFALGGSLMYEYFGETTRPSYNDLLNSTLSGAFGGEILYRLTSNLLDERKHGLERFFREFGAAIIDPARFINRIFQGKLGEVTSQEVYQKEPLDVTLDAGAHIVNNTAQFSPGALTEMFDIQFDYGDPFEVRKRKPFDYFKVRGGLNFGHGMRFVDNISGHGILFGKNIIKEKDDDDFRMLAGIFQYSDYWNNNTFELGGIGFGAGAIAKLPLTVHGDLAAGLHLALIPLAGTSTNATKIEHVAKDYEYGGGAEARAEASLNFDWLRASFISYFFAIRNYTGLPETELVGIVKPNVSAQIAGPLRIGFEHRIYFNDLFPKDFANYHAVTTEERIFLELFFSH
jgi:hypothetical protein